MNENEKYEIKEDHYILYLIQNEEAGIIKIGVTQNIVKRIKLFQNISGMKLILLKSYIIKNAFNIEKLFHYQFYKKRTYGEWFRLNDADLQSIDLFISSLEKISEDDCLSDLIPKEIEIIISNHLKDKPTNDKIQSLFEIIQFAEYKKVEVN